MFFFIEIGTRRVHLAGVTANPTQAWVTQQARQILWKFDDETPRLRFLIRDNDGKYSETFDNIFISEGFHVLPTPFRAPNANSFAERWVRTARDECLDHLLILNDTHLQRVLSEFTHRYYNVARPHQGIDQRSPIPTANPSTLDLSNAATSLAVSSTTITAVPPTSANLSSTRLSSSLSPYQPLKLATSARYEGVLGRQNSQIRHGRASFFL